MKKSVYGPLVSLVLLIGVAFAFSTVADCTKTYFIVLASALGVILLIAIIAIAVHRSNQKIAQQQAADQQQAIRAQRQAAAAQAKKQQEEKKEETHEAPDRIDGKPCVYHYEKVDVVPKEGMRMELWKGMRVQFQEEGQQIKVICRQVELGILNQKKIEGMVSDWLKRNDPIYAVLTRADDQAHVAAVDILFYQDKAARLLKRDPDAKKIKLVGTTTEEIQGNLDMTEENEICELDYDAEKQKYAVYCGFCIGYLPASAQKMIEENGEDAYDIIFAGTEIKDNLKLDGFVYMFER